MWTIKLTGVVQGVGFRPAVARTASRIGALGFVRNDGSHVTIGTDTDPELFLSELDVELGPMASIDGRVIEWSDWKAFEMEAPVDFLILPSTQGERDSSLPYDTAICDSCLREMLDPLDRRYLHPFTNCTDCGARYTLIGSLPYDRERTSMEPFELCGDCDREYSDLSFRRFHAQTLSCPVDGPSYRYLNAGGKVLSTGWASFMDCARSISDGKLLVVKGWGGMHIVSDPGRTRELREWYKRPFKPFAIMVKDIRTAGELAHVSDHEKDLLVSPARPIVLLRKRIDVPDIIKEKLDLLSPGLDNIGIYLPYSGIHHLLFKALEDIGSRIGWLVMTSANPPGEPMALELEDATKLKADGYFVHDRSIMARCDDTVLVPFPYDDRILSRTGPFGSRSLLIRKSRGMIPDPLDLPHERTLLGVGAERNVSVSISRTGRSFTSPYIGNSRHPSVLGFMEDSARRLMYLFGAEDIEAVVVDEHPRYNTRRWGSEFAEDRGIPLMEVQHHHAHAASLMVDAGIERSTTVVVDGVGYGDDGTPWGGEVIDTNMGSCRRVGHLEPFGLPGGDVSVHHPERIAYWLTREAGHHLELEDHGTMDMLDRTHDKAIRTTSLGRVLDALSSLMLGVTRRTYDGEPAMRVEALLSSSVSPINGPFRQDVIGSTIGIVGRWRTLIEEISRTSPSVIRPGFVAGYQKKADLAMGFVSSIIDDLVRTAVNEGNAYDENGVQLVGLSGGVSYNVPIVKRFVDSCSKLGAMPVLHSRVPPGDGGISVGQVYLGGLMLDGEI
ncbi:MAG: carbamoyltransferase HypF [Candidatus Thermoplasmatota archaeon]|nr:carbamoyltransferase HypF [Candidatus Thermoplasmatota archaeon]